MVLFSRIRIFSRECLLAVFWAAVCYLSNMSSPAQASATSGASAKARKDSIVTLGGMTLGFIPRPALGFVVSFNLLGNLVPEAFLEYGAYKTPSTRSRRTRMGGRLLFFPGNSFYFGIGAALDATLNRELTSTSTLLIDPTAPSTGAWYGTYQQIDGEVSLGNRWQWDSGLTLGVTWIGYSRGLRKESQSAENKGVSATYAESLGRDLERTSKEGGLHFFKIVFGASL